MTIMKVIANPKYTDSKNLGYKWIKIEHIYSEYQAKALCMTDKGPTVILMEDLEEAFDSEYISSGGE